MSVALAGLVLLSAASLVVGVAELDTSVLLHSRVPRTLALVLAGSALAVSGQIMQLLTRNVFVEPSTAGTMEFATAGLLVSTLFFPGAPVVVKMCFGAVAALIGTAIFLRVLAAVPLKDMLVTPLVGMMLGGVVSAGVTFVAYRADLVQSLSSWTTGDFSAVLAGRYELLWIAGALTLLAALLADRFTVAGMGEAFTTNLGLDHRRTVMIGMGVVAVVSATVVVTVGALPFLGLVVPNIVRNTIGDNCRRAVPWVAVLGAGFVLACDLVSRLVIHPFEMPIGTVMGVVGALAFLVILLRGRR
ncbi:MAG: iron chelate uptake ABC transporter family permease subunit [Luteococcus sp.]|uniref:ABC transporter permease n=1 Tax=Luteococcus sp. TaxID=1969402 RepID=UPI0026486B1D|nr:iron chelate uptake ABC transporter family permease subunit [Luteococcus sp.]MDN5562227.1 iron chelate uptake ABC transporter family permease subunit [Luteococcus sp.]